jgi:hypothetical protein
MGAPEVEVVVAMPVDALRVAPLSRDLLVVRVPRTGVATTLVTS